MGRRQFAKRKNHSYDNLKKNIIELNKKIDNLERQLITCSSYIGNVERLSIQTSDLVYNLSNRGCTCSNGGTMHIR